MKKKIILTGDRPTGPLHLGHYVGTLANRIKLQEEYTQYIMIADVQALTDNYEYPEKVHDNVMQIALDYLAVGINPKKSTIFIQSMIPAIAELTIFYLNLVSLNRLKRNPTIKEEIKQKKFGEHLPTGFLVYPISQAADITCVKAELIPVGADQLPMIEQTNEIVRTFNRLYNCSTLVEATALIPEKGARLIGIDGKGKMSKSLNNAIYLSDPFDVVTKKIKMMYTDPGHLRVEDPGKVEGNVVFTYLDIFDPRTDEVAQLKEQYQQGGLGDMVLKKRLIDVMETVLKPIYERHTLYSNNKDEIMNILRAGTERTNHVADQTLKEVKEAMHLVYV